MLQYQKPSLLLSSLLVLLIATLSFAVDVEFTQKIGGTDSPTNNQIVPHFKLKNTGVDTLFLKDISIEYYIYEPQLNVATIAWRNDWCKIGSDDNAGSSYNISFSRLETPNTSGDKKADIASVITFVEGTYLLPGEVAELHVAFYRNDWGYTFDETQHWSYVNSNTFVTSGKTVVRNYNTTTCPTAGCLVSGDAPVSSISTMAYPKDCGEDQDMKYDGKLYTSSISPISGKGVSLAINRDEVRFYKNINNTITTSTLRHGVLNLQTSAYPSVHTTTLKPHQIYTSGTILASAANIDGTIKTRELVVTSTGWADYVFKESYKLKPLSEIEQFIKKNGHLPEIPSEKEVAEKGVSVGEMQTKLLAKIEELTLHCISLEKEIVALKKKTNEK